MYRNAPALDFLLAAQNRDGGWGYAGDSLSATEATAAVILALAPMTAGAEAYSAGLAWLRRAQHRDGGWGYSAEDPASSWLTAWAVMALAKAEAGSRWVSQGVTWLLEVKVLKQSEDAMQQVRRTLELNPNLAGWPWQPGQATWVEPTALALLALSEGPSSDSVARRLDEGVQYLADRRCRNGGWNIGNPQMFSQALPPRACPTAWALLALARLAPAAVQSGDLAALREDMERDGGALALAWGLLALQASGQEAPALADRLAGLQASDGGWNGNPYHTAVAISAGRGRL